jgi:hypothetical protein
MQLLQNAKTNPYQSPCTEAHAIALGFFLTNENQHKKTFAVIAAHLGCAFADLKNQQHDGKKNLCGLCVKKIK